MSDSAGHFSCVPVAVVASDYADKFGVPRQPGLVPAARAVVSLLAPYDMPDAVDGLSAYSHLWLSFIFDRSPLDFRPKVRPPRLGGNTRIGVFATRSTHRPNRLGLSCVSLLDIATSPRPQCAPWAVSGRRRSIASRTHLLLGGHDLVDGTPIVDIKPYLAWVDSLPSARAELAPTPPSIIPVHWASDALRTLDAHRDAERLRVLIEQVLAQDPRPAYQRSDGQRVYGVALCDVDVRFSVDGNGVTVQAIVAAQPPM